MQETDIVIVGAGPTGLVMALELSVQGIPFRLVDKAEQPGTKSRALAMHARSIELLTRHGIRDELIAAGSQPEGVSLVVGGSEVAKMQLDHVASQVTDSAFPGPLIINQCDTERILLGCLETKYGVSPERGVTVADIKQDDNGASLTLNGELVRCKYVVGADGSHSVVRHSSPVMTFEGAEYPQEFILCDAHVRPGPNPRSLNRAYFCLGQGLLVLMPMNNGKTVRFIASRAGRFKDAVGKELPTLHDFQEFLDDVMPGFGTLHDPEWLNRYHLHHRCVNVYRDRRLFVAGDAAHIHSPIGGQGMNTGIQDAVNLGWKLAAAVRHANASSADPTTDAGIEQLLTSYHEERHPVGQKLLSSTDYVFTWITWSNPIFLKLRNTLLPFLAPPLMKRSAAVQAENFRFITQLGIKYPGSPVVGTAAGFEGPVKGGSRAPDGKIATTGTTTDKGDKWLLGQLFGNRHTLLLFSGPGAETGAVTTDLEAAKQRFVDAAASTDGVKKLDVRTIYTRGAAPTPGNTSSDMDKTYIDVEDGDALHRRYGFQDKAGYVYLRPDLYIAHIGYLEESANELVESLKKAV